MTTLHPPDVIYELARLGKPLPNAGIAKTIAATIEGRNAAARFDGRGALWR